MLLLEKKKKKKDVKGILNFSVVLQSRVDSWGDFFFEVGRLLCTSYTIHKYWGLLTWWSQDDYLVITVYQLLHKEKKYKAQKQ